MRARSDQSSGGGRRRSRVRALPLSGTFSRDGESVSVEIYCLAGTQDPWRLGVIDLSSGGSTVWQETYATDQEAYDAFTAMVEASGLAPFLGRRPEALS
jgi:hypothetical protein